MTLCKVDNSAMGRIYSLPIRFCRDEPTPCLSFLVRSIARAIENGIRPYVFHEPESRRSRSPFQILYTVVVHYFCFPCSVLRGSEQTLCEDVAQQNADY